MSDKVIKNLVMKKRELLDELLRHSIQSIVDIDPSIDNVLVNRVRILEDLGRTDESLRLREKQTGINPMRQEKELYSDIGEIIRSIQDNIAESVKRVEQQKKDIENEQSLLGRERRLTGYIDRGRRYNQNRAVTSL